MNKERINSAEMVEGRPSTKGNNQPLTAVRTQSRGVASLGVLGVRRAAQRDKELKFTALLHHVTVELLRASFYALEREAAAGIDGMGWYEYEVGLMERLGELHSRIHQGRYRARPSRRVYIPKPDGTRRPLGIQCLEDKIVQQAVATVLNAIYETDFKGFSYGFRPGRSAHDALDALSVALIKRKVNWVLDADIQSFYDTLDHQWMMQFLKHRIADKRLLRLIKKWLEAGVSEEGKVVKLKIGVPQGAVISPILSNIYLHYVFDLWSQAWRGRVASGEVIMLRYADDTALGFQHRDEASRFLEDFKNRLSKFGLTLHPDKTRLIEFGRFAEENRRRRGEGKPETFDFLGLTHICSRRHRDGRFTVKRRTVKKRFRKQLQAIKQTLLRYRHVPIPRMGAWLNRVLQGHYNYYAVPGNLPSLKSFCNQVTRYWLSALRRRSQRHRMTWLRFRELIRRWLPRPRILHPYPDVRFYAIHPR